MAAVIPAKLSQIMPLVKARLMGWLGWPPERVIIGLSRPFNPHERWLRFWPRTHVTHQVYRHGGGRKDVRVTRRLAVELWTRLALDPSNANEDWMLDASLGHLDAEHAIFDALEEFQPTDAGGNWLVDRPMKLQPCSEPATAKEEKEWGMTVQEYDVTYVLALDQSYQ